MRGRRPLPILSLALALIVAAALPAAAQKVPGVTDTGVAIAALLDLTGPLQHPGNEARKAMDIFFADLNEQGGVQGRKVSVIYEDHATNPPKAVAAAKLVLSRHDVFAFVNPMASPVMAALFPLIESEKIPTVSPMAVSSILYEPPKRYVFATITSTYDVSWVVAEYIANDLGAKGGKLGVIHQDDEYGRSGLRGYQEAAPKLGLSLVSEQAYKRGSVDFSSQVLNLRRDGVEFVAHVGLGAAHAAILKEAVKLGWKPRVFGEIGSMTLPTLELAGEAAALSFWGYDKAVDTDEVPGIQAVRRIVQRKAPEMTRIDPNFLLAWVGSMVFTEGLKRAGRNLDREGYVAALEGIRSFDTGGIMAPISFGANVRKGGGAVKIYKPDLARKTYVALTDWRTPKR
ncbi:MAG: ABC transporter substrate-binding protein [Candidatus Rokubacteria bacterium]|nr:ABC transporter substrate-binding protein [Candidatus Rokubacteria bacterium]